MYKCTRFNILIGFFLSPLNSQPQDKKTFHNHSYLYSSLVLVKITWAEDQFLGAIIAKKMRISIESIIAIIMGNS